MAVLHQEDLCQALGLPSTRKYEQEGGPTLTAVIELVRANVAQPVTDVRRLIEWQAFNVVVGNSDGHGNNLALVYVPGGGSRLAPFYDLVSTRHYDGIDRMLAMAVGGQRDPDQLTAAHWGQLARDLTIGERFLIATVRTLAERCVDAVGGWATEFRRLHGEQPVLQTLPRTIRRRGQKLVSALAVTRPPGKRPRGRAAKG